MRADLCGSRRALTPQRSYARVGPNPRWAPAGQYHLFDGDGAVRGRPVRAVHLVCTDPHTWRTQVFSVRLKDGVARFSNAWVRTARFQVEHEAGRSCLPMLGDMHGATGVALLALHQVRSSQRHTCCDLRLTPCAQAKAALGGPCSTPLAMGTGNTALEFHAGRLLALQEGSLPWHLRVLCDGALETIGACTFDGAAPRTFTAHPKVDALTSEMCFISYQVDKTPHLTYGVLDAEGKPLHVTPVPIRFPQMLHDFAITRSYAVFWDLPLAFEPKEMVTEDKLPFVYDKPRGAAFGVMQRRAEGSACRWFSLPGCMIFHSLACWEEEDAQLVRLFAARIEDFDLTRACPRCGCCVHALNACAILSASRSTARWKVARRAHHRRRLSDVVRIRVRHAHGRGDAELRHPAAGGRHWNGFSTRAPAPDWRKGEVRLPCAVCGPSHHWRGEGGPGNAKHRGPYRLP